MKANIFQKIATGAHASLLLFYYTFRVLFHIFIKHDMTRERGDVIFRGLSKRLLDYIRLRYTLHNASYLIPPEGRPCIVMSNHSSVYDIPLIAFILDGKVRMISKKEMLYVPFFGAAMRRTDFISIDRKNREKAIQDLDVAKKKMLSGFVLWGAPEGSRSRTGELGPFKKGLFITALELDAMIIPVGIRGAHRILAPRSVNLYLDQHVDIHVGEPIDTTHYTMEQRDQLIEHTRNRIASLLTEK